MPSRKDDTGRHWVEMEIAVPGTPEQVWHALATGPGNTAWFTKASIEERTGGELRFDFGPNGSSTGEVTTWEPPRKFGYVERAWAEGAPPVATEITVITRGGNQCVVRMVHSLFSSSDDWDDQLEGFEKGWTAFFEVLRIYLTRFAGRPAASFPAVARVEGDSLQAWRRLTSQLSLAGADAGERRSTPARPEALSGVIEAVQQHEQQRSIIMRIDAPGPGVAMIGAWSAGADVTVGANMYFYGDDAVARASTSEPKWNAWLAELFPALETSGRR